VEFEALREREREREREIEEKVRGVAIDTTFNGGNIK
jgi:hypothetical protein